MPPDVNRKLASGWLWLAYCFSGSTPGLFAILLVAFAHHAPYVQDIFPWVDFSTRALVVHVNLSVLLWLMAFAGCCGA